ncbi:MAG: leucyl aminopeptidase family protein, partial [Litorimonas sp.]
DAGAVSDTVAATALGRDLINTPAGDMGPVALQAAAEALAEQHGASVSTVIGDALLEQNYPMIHAVGRAAHEAPRLVELEWGDASHPRLALIGKGITFDTGGVNMKGASGARLMKKDMGGAAHALALSSMIMAARLPIRLHCLLAIAENAVSANAYRPGDILPSRAGLTVEIDNTDAEGRLVLGDALVKATESDPVLMIDFATLTGAARVALGPQLPPFFTNRPHLHDLVARHAMAELDPLWPMPLWQPYHAMLRSPIADMKNSGGSFAGAVTAALFLERFVDDRPWMHFDVYGWNPSNRPGHPKGADVYAVRGLFAWLASGGLNTPMDPPGDAVG